MKKIILCSLCLCLLCACQSAKEEKHTSASHCDDTKETCGIEILDMKDYEDFEDEEHMFIESNMKEVISFFKNKEDKIVYFGYPRCPWCRDALPVMNDCAKAQGKSIYYVKTKDEEEKFLYNKEEKAELFTYIGDVLEENDEGEKHLFVPFVIVIKDGKLESSHLGTLDEHDATKEKMTDEQVKELHAIYQDMFKK